MTINEHISEFAGKKVVEWQPDDAIGDTKNTIYKIAVEYDDGEGAWEEKFNMFLDDPKAAQVTGLVVGPWSEVGVDNNSAPIVAALAEASKQLPKLDTIFLGDITFEEAEISWIEQCDLSPLFAAYPNLAHFAVRGAQNLSLGDNLRLDKLKTLVVETGGMPKEVFEQAVNAKLPQLEHLELWLGTEDYEGEIEVADLQTLLAGGLFPKLQYLGLRDSEIADDIAKALNGAPITDRIKTLDLSLGNLSDEGANALLANPAVAKLQKLDIHHHYCSPGVIKKLQSLNIDLDASDPQEADEYDGEQVRYVAVSE